MSKFEFEKGEKKVAWKFLGSSRTEFRNKYSYLDLETGVEKKGKKEKERRKRR